MQKILFVVLLAFASLSCCATAFAQQPMRLYHGTLRPPSDVFVNGLTAAGSNIDPIAHASGVSCAGTVTGVARSGFVTLNEHVADAQVHGTYVYVVTPDASAAQETATFDLVNAFRHLAPRAQENGLNLRQRSTIQSLISHDALQGQHVSRRIPPEWIEMVHVYQWNASGGLDLLRTERNSRFREPYDTASRGAFSRDMISAIQNAPPSAQITYATAANGTAVSVCTTSSSNVCGRTSRTGPLATGQPPLQCVTEPLPSRNSLYWQAVGLLLGD